MATRFLLSGSSHDLHQTHTFDVLPKAHGGRHGLAFAVGFFFQDIVVIRSAIRPILFLLLLVTRGQFFGKSEHGEDDQQHGESTQQESTPPKNMAIRNNDKINKVKMKKMPHFILSVFYYYGLEY